MAILDVKLLGPVQLNVAPMVVELAVIVILGVVQVKIPLPMEVVKLGGVVFCDTCAVASAVHPLTGLVTFKV